MTNNILTSQSIISNKAFERTLNNTIVACYSAARKTRRCQNVCD